MLSASRVPGSFARSVAKWRRSIASPTCPRVSPGSMAVRPKLSGSVRCPPLAASAASYLLSTAGCSPHAFWRSSTSSPTAPTADSGTSTSTRRRLLRIRPPGSRIVVSSSKSSPLGVPIAASGKTRLRVRSSKSGTSFRRPTRARTRSPTGPGA